MKTKVIGSMLAVVLLASGGLVWAESGHDHGAHDHGAQETSTPSHHEGSHGASEPEGHAGASEPEGLAGAWTALWSARDGIAADVEAGRLETIHEKAEPIPALAQALLRESGDLEPVKRARVESAVGQIPKVADGLHDAADAGDADRTRRGLERLDVLLQLIRAQYPAGALPAAPDHDGDAARSG